MLDEETLPLQKGSIRNARDSYGAFIVVMSPTNFLNLTTDHTIFREIKMDVQDNYRTGKHAEYVQKGKYELPYLIVDYQTGKVTGHEGRHRAMMLLIEGGTRFPCSIRFRHPRIWEVEYYAYEDDDDTHQRQFNTDREAEAFMHSLHEANFDSIDTLYDDIRIEMVGAGTMKGSPRSKGWDYDAWKIEDFPPYLEGQYTSTKVPSSAMRIGLVKGYYYKK